MSLTHLGMIQELSGILAASPLHQIELASPEDVDNVRKPVEDACPICFMDFDPSEEVTWCKAGCGNNVHKLCFDKWISTNKASGSAVRCVYWYVIPSLFLFPQMDLLRFLTILPQPYPLAVQ